jgi:hypothetical protein
MASKIKVDNIENQCGGAVVTKCGATTTISGSVVKADDIQAADGGNIINQCGTTITLGASGDTINLASGASQSGFGRTGTVDWETTPKTASFTAVSGEGYFCNTTSSAFTVNLPAGSAGAIVSVADYAATWQTNNLTVSPNGSDKIGGENENVTLSTQGQSVTFVYVDSTQGWINTMDSTSNVRGAPPFIVATGGTETTCGDFKIHTFTGPGTFTVSSTAPGPSGNPNNLDYLVVAGGGGSKAPAYAGGGAGGFRYSASTYTSPTCAPGHPLRSPSGLTATVSSFPITVGAGGTGTTGTSNTPGGVSTFSTITSTGGGRGGNVPAPSAPSEMNGGSGGGGNTGACTSTSPGGAGNTPPVSPPQGNPGGTGQQQGGVGDVGGGGGGATAAGSNGALPGAGGNGGAGAGLPTAFGSNGVPCGSFRYYAGGGGARSNSSPGNGGIGGGGNGFGPSRSQTAAIANTGGGGGSGPCVSLTNGGSGVVVIRYKYQ